MLLLLLLLIAVGTKFVKFTFNFVQEVHLIFAITKNS